MPRLFRPIIVPAQLVRPPPWHGARHRFRRRGSRVHRIAALDAVHDRTRRLADRLLDAGPSPSGGPRPHKPAAPQTTRGHGSAARRGCRAACLRHAAPVQHRRSRVGCDRLDPGASPAYNQILVGGTRLFRGTLRLVCGAGAPNQIPDRDRRQPHRRCVGPRLRQPRRHPRRYSARSSVRPGRTGVGVGNRQPRLRLLLPGVAGARPLPVNAAGLRDGDRAGRSGLRSDLGHGRHRGGSLSGPAFRHDLRHRDAVGPGAEAPPVLG